MINKLYTQHRHLILYGVIGVSGAAIDFIFYLFFYHLLHVPPSLASFMSVSLGIINNFILNNTYNFKTTGHTFSRLVTFYLIGCLGAILSAVLIFIFFNILHVDATVAKLLTIAPIVLMQYTINKSVSFSDDPHLLFRQLRAFISRHIFDILLFTIAAILFVVSVYYLPALDDMDNMLGGKLILEGQLPYRDFFSHHAPGMYFLAALIYPFTNNDAFLFRLLFNAILFALSLGLYALLRKYTGVAVARLFLLLLAIGHTIGYLHLPLGESLVALLLCIAIVLIYIRPPAMLLPRRQKVLIALILFTIPILSLAYIFPTLVLYGVHFVLILRETPRHRPKVACTTVVYYATPYAISLLILLVTGALTDAKYDLFDFNSIYYAPMVGEQGGGVVKTVIAMVTGTIHQLGSIIAHILNPHQIVQTFLLVGIGLFTAYLWLHKRKVAAISMPLLLLVLNTRSNAFNAPALTSKLDQLAQHGSLYFCVALLAGCVGALFFVLRTHHWTMRSVGVLYLVIIPFAIVNVWAIRTNSVFLAKTSPNYHSYAAALKQSSTVTTMNRIATPADYTWVAPTDFASQLYITSHRASKYTFYLPWLDASPKIRTDLINSLKIQHPKVIYLKERAGGYSTQLTTFLSQDFFTVHDARLKDYYFNKDNQEPITKELTAYGYQIN